MKKSKKKIFRGLLLLALVLVISSKLSLFEGPILGASKTPIDHELDQNYREAEGLYSRNALVIDRKTSKIILGKNMEERIHPASMTKVMTAIVGLEKADKLRRRVEISSETIDYCRRNGMSVSGFQEADRPRLEDLIYGIMLESGGEASISLAQAIAGDEASFVDLMNEKARELGMDGTHFSNSSGITDPENYSTVSDIGKLFDYALKNKKFRKIIGSEDYEARGLRGLFSKHEILNNVFIKRNILDIKKDYLLGGKTGYTEAAGLCLVSYGRLNSREYIVVTAKADGDPASPQYNFIDLAHIYGEIEN